MAGKRHSAATMPEPATAIDPHKLARIYAKWRREASSPEYFTAAISVVRMAGHVTRKKYLTAMIELDEKYPGRGWREQADDLEAFYFKQGLKLKELPRVNGSSLITEKVLQQLNNSGA